MGQDLVDLAIVLMENHQFQDALPLLLRAVNQNPSDWNIWYMAGQCYRFLNNIDGAITFLSHAVELGADHPSAFLALGIAYQLRNRWAEAIEAFRRAIDIDPDYELAYNSLALTQKKAGDLAKALYNYDAGAKALARRIVKSMVNDPNNPIFKYRDTTGSLWIEYATYAAIYLACNAYGISSVAFPTGEMAIEEGRTERHAGLYWIDIQNKKGGTERLYLPNYFNTFREALRKDVAYSTLIGNRGTVLEILGRYDEARPHFNEALEFEPQMR